MSKVFNISGQVQEKIETLAKRFNIEIGQVMSIYMQNYSKVENEKTAFRLTAGAIQEEFGNVISNAPTMYVYVLHDFGTSDIYELMRAKSLRLYDDPETQQKAIDDGLISFDGVPLDYRKQVFGKENENYGQPLTGSSYQRSILAIKATDPLFKDAMFVELTADKEFAKNIPEVEAFKFYSVRGNPNKKNPSRINLSSGTKFREYASEVTVAEISAKIPSISIGDAETVYNSVYAGKKKVDTLTAIRGSVTWMNLDAIKGNRSFVIFDDDTMLDMRCKISEKTPVKFQLADDVIVFAKLFPGRDGKIGAQVRTYMVV